MIPVVTPEEMAKVDADAPEPVEELIDRAGDHVARHALDVLGGSYGRRVVVLAGKGNNGADGRAAAARLRRRGVRVEVIDAVQPPQPLPPSDLVIDAAYGTGFRGTFDAPDPRGAPVLAVDIPSGVDALTGQVHGRPFRALCTVTFQALKPGLVFHPGAGYCGDVVVADIGLDVSAAAMGLADSVDVVGWWPRREPTAHKWHHSVAIVAGSPGMTGAAAMTAAAAMRAGAGMVRLHLPAGVREPRVPVEVVTRELEGSDWLATVLGDAHRFGALVVGPGLGRGEETAAAVRALIAGAPAPVVVDADGLHALATAPRARDVLAGRSHPTVLTPHAGEFAAIFGGAFGDDHPAAVRRLAADTGAVVLLKGPTTIVADPGGDVRLVDAGDQRLATAGTGDVLSGIVGAALAGGLGGLEAAAGGAWVHGAAAALGPRVGLVATDVIEQIPAVLGSLIDGRGGW